LQDLVTIPQIAARLGVSRERVRALVLEGKFPQPVGRIGRVLVFNKRDLEKFVRQRARRKP
jgi:excisionase family DNA binding protein